MKKVNLADYGITEIVEDDKPTVKLLGTDGNIYALMAKLRRQLRDQGKADLASKVLSEIERRAKSYDEALAIMMEYVNIT